MKSLSLYIYLHNPPKAQDSKKGISIHESHCKMILLMDNPSGVSDNP